MDFPKTLINYKSHSLYSSIGLIILSQSIISFVCSKYVQAQTLTRAIEFQLPNWATETWLKNDKVYKKIEDEIDTALMQNKLTAQNIATYKSQADKNAQDAVAQFRWTYAAYRANNEKFPIENSVYPFVSALSRPPNPHSYEYSRIGFLVQTQLGPDPHYISLGQRLLAQKPSDYLVEYQLKASIDPTLSPKAKMTAFKYARDLIRMRPNDARSYAALGGVYYYLWTVSHSRIEGQQAIVAYQHCLQLGPSARGRNLAASIIDRIRQG